MKITLFAQNRQRSQRVIRPFVALLISLFLGIPVLAQKRDADVIVTTGMDSLFVKVTEVGLVSLTYRKIEGDTAATWTINKTEIQKVIFRNGEIEEFSPSGYQTPLSEEVRLYKVPPKTKYAMTLSERPTEQLLEQKALYGRKYVPQKAVGLASFATGGGFLVYGFMGMFASIFTLSDEIKGGTSFGIGVGVATAIGLPLTIFGIKNKKKYRAIEAELRSRGM